ncbi:ABC transporter ATP-binding protein [Rhizobium leguminosarum]|uniref:ABC transporter domain-containing protein n=2 Tax=Rhizobium leguminosarum TaxID=384 RepID=A0A154IQV0_RHILE|nr:ABC transporter ATP-binding protein [Rhizobium leguminosarum]KZB02852.1 hypothetical protein A4A59_08260 [Rhizobium leguminosarum]
MSLAVVKPLSEFDANAAFGSSPLLQVQNLAVLVPVRRGQAFAVKEVNLDVEIGRTTALVGESGSGKTLMSRAILRLDAPPIMVKGSIKFQGLDLLKLSNRLMDDVRGRKIGMVFQDPHRSLNPTMTVQTHFVHLLRGRAGMSDAAARLEGKRLLDQVQIARSGDRLLSYPHELSGGMKQRIMIGLAIATKPSLLIADEPTTALDPYVQLEILTLLRDLQAETRMAILLISHDLAVVREVAHTVAVMYAGRTVETGAADRVLTDPRHPYTQALLNSAPDRGVQTDWLPALDGIVPDIENDVVGCAFADRCAVQDRICRNVRPALRWGEDERMFACHRPNGE